jgi:hypothetical protein
VPDAARRYGTLSGPRGFARHIANRVQKMNMTNRRDSEPVDRDPGVMWDWPTAAAVLVIVVIAGLMIGNDRIDIGADDSATTIVLAGQMATPVTQYLIRPPYTYPAPPQTAPASRETMTIVN